MGVTNPACPSRLACTVVAEDLLLEHHQESLVLGRVLESASSFLAWRADIRMPSNQAFFSANAAWLFAARAVRLSAASGCCWIVARNLWYFAVSRCCMSAKVLPSNMYEPLQSLTISRGDSAWT